MPVLCPPVGWTEQKGKRREAAVLERISVQQFLATLEGDEFACAVALYLGYFHGN